VTFQEGLHQVDKATKIITEANQKIAEATYQAFTYSFSWWIALIMLITPWVLWGIFRKKESSARLLFAAFIVIILSSILDAYGVDRGKWSYPVKVIPLPTMSYSFRYSLVPVSIMFLIQYKPHIHPLIKGFLFGAFGAYIGMPIMNELHLYKEIDWHYTYSFFILVMMYLIAHWFSKRTSFDVIDDNPHSN
jgi:hypothetical protein